MINSSTLRDLEVTVTVNAELIPCKPQMTKHLTFGAENARMVGIKVTLSPKILFQQIQVAVNPPPPLVAQIPSVILSDVESGQQLDILFWIYMSKSRNPGSLTVPIVISMLNRQGVLRIIETTAALPAEFILNVCSPQKEAKYKLTISIEDSTVVKDILKLFPEFAKDKINQTALGLRCLYTNDFTTVVQGSNSKRYRIQSNCLSILPLALELFLQRLKQRPINSGHLVIKPITDCVSITQPNFVGELCQAFSDHFNCRQAVKHCDQEMEKMSRQMRLFQGKLMLILKQDPTPTTMFNSAGKLLRWTHGELGELRETLMDAVDKLQESQLMLENHLRLINLVVLHSGLPHQIKENLAATIVSPVRDWIEMVGFGFISILCLPNEFISFLGLGRGVSTSHGNVGACRATEQEFQTIGH